MIGNFDDATYVASSKFTYVLLSNRQVVSLCEASANYLPTDAKLSKIQLSKMIQSGWFLGRLLGPLLKTSLPLMKM